MFRVTSVNKSSLVILLFMCLDKLVINHKVWAYSKWPKPTCQTSTTFTECEVKNVYQTDTTNITFYPDNNLNSTTYIKLDISESVLNYLPTNLIKTFNSISSLRIQSCHLLALKKGDFRNSINLNSILIQNNKMNTVGDLTFEGANEVKILNLNNNQIRIITSRAFENLKKLNQINLAQNRIIRLDPKIFSHNKHIVILSLKMNELRYLNFLRNLNQLSHLTLSYNRIAHVDRGEFTNISKLTNLLVPENCLTNFNFTDFKSVSKISISQNYLINVPSKQPMEEKCRSRPDDYLHVNTMFDIDLKFICLGSTC